METHKNGSKHLNKDPALGVLSGSVSGYWVWGLLSSNPLLMGFLARGTFLLTSSKLGEISLCRRPVWQWKVDKNQLWWNWIGSVCSLSLLWCVLLMRIWNAGKVWEKSCVCVWGGCYFWRQANIDQACFWPCHQNVFAEVIYPPLPHLVWRGVFYQEQLVHLILSNVFN